MRLCYHLGMPKLTNAVRAYFKELGKLGGHKGGKAGGRARAAKLTPERRREIASAAIKARWDRHRARQVDW